MAWKSVISAILASTCDGCTFYIVYRFATYCVPDSVPRETFNMSKTEPQKWIAAMMSDAELYD